MSLKKNICNSSKYDFGKLLNKVDFDELDEYVNIHDQSDVNLLMWMCKTKYNKAKIIHYIDKYYKLFDFDKMYQNKSNLIIKISVHQYIDNYNILIYLLNKINIIKEITKTNNYKNLLCHVICNTTDIHNIINLTGILNRPFDELSYYNHGIFMHMYYYCNSSLIILKNTKILVNYFGILNKPSCCMIIYNRFCNTNICNKLILVYGKY